MRSILAIDDVYNNLLLIKSILNKKFPKYNVLLATSGKEGVRIAKQEKPDTILLDIYMPEMDG
ncbi:MAG: response regulator, partial [Bacteroidota bacterium]